jgi:hypothetical protein
MSSPSVRLYPIYQPTYWHLFSEKENSELQSKHLQRLTNADDVLARVAELLNCKRGRLVPRKRKVDSH